MIARMALAIVGLGCAMLTPAFAGVWSDGFQDDATPEWGWLLRPGAATATEGKGYFTVETTGVFGNHFAITDSGEWHDFTFSVDVNIQTIRGQFCCAGAMVHGRNDFTLFYSSLGTGWAPDDFAAFGVAPYPGLPESGQGAFATKFINGSAVEGDGLDFEPELDRWYRLRVDVAGGRAVFLIDGDVIGEFGHDEPIKGHVGLTLANSVMRVDNVVVSGADIPDGGPGGAVLAVDASHGLATTWAGLKRRDAASHH
ncbi:MAG: hypothetical protein ABGY41_07585 [Candidatus Poribacteria bacterium]